MVNNYLDITILNRVCFVVLPDGTCALPYIFPSFAGGNIDVKEEELTAVEVGWIGTFGPSTYTLSIYDNDTTNAIDFYTAATYTAAMPPPNFPLPPFLLDVPPPLGLAGLLPAVFSYRNAGEATNRGEEFCYNYNPRGAWSFYFNSSWQDEPEISGIDKEPLPGGELVYPVNIPPEWRFNGGLAYGGDKFFWSANANYQDEAFWTDILDSRFFGPTDSFTSVNAAAGYRFGDKVTLQVDGQNILDEDIQQHVFGDIISRKVTGRIIIEF